MGEHPHEAKRRLRRTLFGARSHVAASERRRVALAICDRVIRLPAFLEARDVVAYAAMGGEVDPSLIVDAALARGCRTYFPRLAGDDLEFRQAVPAELVAGPRGFCEAASGAPWTGDRPAVVIVPGVAFDLAGARLGRGGGHYDRALAQHPLVATIGVATELQVVDRLPEEPWDRRVDVVVTENRIIVPRGCGPRVTKENQSC